MLCEIDGKSLSHSKSVHHHKKIHLNEDHHCDMCSKTFRTLKYLTEHMKNTHSDVLYPCHTYFKSKRGLMRHIANSHQKSGNRCDLCAETFRQDKLKRHQESCSKRLKTKESKESESIQFWPM